MEPTHPAPDTAMPPAGVPLAAAGPASASTAAPGAAAAPPGVATAGLEGEEMEHHGDPGGKVLFHPPGTGPVHRAGFRPHKSHDVEMPSGEVHHHRTAVGAALDKVTERVKEAVPGTKEHQMTHMSSSATGAGPGHVGRARSPEARGL